MVKDMWSTFSTMLEYRNLFGQCVFEGKVYVSGGENAQGAKLASCECYDPSTDMWTSIPSMPSTCVLLKELCTTSIF